ncbi:MAG: molybdenum cofactor guanylyltransferase [Verrucomicrobiales bacterium]
MTGAGEFAAVLFTGGRSRRMGCDKAFLSPAPSAPALWEIQLEKLRALNSAELFIAANIDQVFPENTPGILRDATADRGPVAALLTCFSQTQSPMLLTLAVDMPAMETSWLASLLAEARPERGLVCRLKGGDFFEPFPALYPKEIGPLAAENLASGRDSMQDLIRAGIEHNLLDTRVVPPEETPLFANLNRPTDLDTG